MWSANALIGVLASQRAAATPSTLARFVISNPSMSYPNSVPKSADFDTIIQQDGFSPALSGTITSITVPTGATRLICSCWTGSPTSTGNYFEITLMNGSSGITGFRQVTHGGFFSANHFSGVAQVAGGDAISVRVVGNHSSSTAIVFAGKFY